MAAGHQLLFSCKLLHLLLLLLLAVVGTGEVIKRFPRRKSWWTKPITDNLHVSGQLSTKQIKLANDAGFKSIISLFDIPAQSPPESENAPSTDQSAVLAAIIGLTFRRVLLTAPTTNTSEWATVETIEKFAEAFDSSPKPVILYGMSSYAAAFVALVHDLNRTTNAVGGSVEDIVDLFEHSAVLGYNYVEDMNLKDLVHTVAGVESALVKDYPDPPQLQIPMWYSTASWKLKPYGGNIWLSGQIDSTELPMLEESGFEAVVNMRRGVSWNSQPTQEEAVLLNIKDRTGTYDRSKNPVRQQRQTLEANRVDATLPNSYISSDSKFNYESINVLQFGDAIGYNETIEREAFDGSGLEYYHNPIGAEYNNYQLRLWEAYRNRLMTLAKTKSAILLQCRTGYRSSVMAMLMYGCLHGQNKSEVLLRAHRVGYPFRLYQSTVLDLLGTVLGDREKHCHPEGRKVIVTMESSAATTTGQFFFISLFVAYILS